MKKVKIIRLGFIVSILVSSGCVGVSARPYNEDEMCWEEAVEVETEFRLFGGCDEAQAVTKKDGEYWMFSNQCVPSGYLQLNGDEIPPGTFCELEEGERNVTRDASEWQGMLVGDEHPPCYSGGVCGLAMACVEEQCGPCSEDFDCSTNEVCVLQHCVLEENVTCRSRRDCEEDDALCVLNGYSSGIRGNETMKAFCRSSSGGDDM